MKAEDFIKEDAPINMEQITKYNNLKFVKQKYNQFNHYNSNGIKLLKDKTF